MANGAQLGGWAQRGFLPFANEGGAADLLPFANEGGLRRVASGASRPFGCRPLPWAVVVGVWHDCSAAPRRRRLWSACGTTAPPPRAEGACGRRLARPARATGSAARRRRAQRTCCHSPMRAAFGGGLRLGPSLRIAPTLPWALCGRRLAQPLRRPAPKAAVVGVWHDRSAGPRRRRRWSASGTTARLARAEGAGGRRLARPARAARSGARRRASSARAASAP